MSGRDHTEARGWRKAVATLRRWVKGEGGASQSGSGATATYGSTAAGAGGVAVGGHVFGDITVSATQSPTPPSGLRSAYLSWLLDQVSNVPLTGVDPKSIREETRRDLDLAAVYTALLTQRMEGSEEPRKHELRLDLKRERLSALAVLNAELRLALLGDPGSGKSTFVNFVALCMAGELLDRAEANLTTLRTPIPQDDDERARCGEPQPQSWDHGALLPLRVVLREFVARRLIPGATGNIAQKDSLWQFIIDELPKSLRDFSQMLRTELLNTGGLLLLDGLDEVPEADDRRAEVKAAVEQFAAAFPKVRILVTSRTYAYQKQDWKLRGFSEAVLAPFGAAQIRRFVERWYAFVGQARKLSEADAQGRAALLNNAIHHNPRLYELAMRPLLLTLMASIHAWRGGTLPDQREELYADAVTLLLDQWESQKVKRREDGTFEISEPSLLEWLQTDQKAMRQLLNQLAYAAHRDQPTLVGTADIKQDILVSDLMKLNLNPDARPQRLIEYLRDRAGLLEPRGVGIYAFPHRTFQEYLAACHLTERDDFPDNIAELLRAEPNRWREVTLLAGAKAARGAIANAWLLAEALCFSPPPAEKIENESGYWGALLAAQILIENRSLNQVSARNRDKVERIRQWLACILVHGALPPIDRAQAGDTLAVVGDPRFRADAWFLLDEPLLGFVEIPNGPFVMGSNVKHDGEVYDNETPQHTLTLPDYYISRCLVTVAQFRAFVRQSGYKLESTRGFCGSANHPVAYITWYDALKYCAWLTTQLREWAETPEPLATLLCKESWVVTLPSEAEWEKAARGTNGQIYPWGNEFDANKANTIETGVGKPSVVGCFSHGASPYGCLDMAGNMWEWTRSLWGKDPMNSDFRYPYQASAIREQLDVPNNVSRVHRGGDCWSDQWLARCAYRGNIRPDSRGDGIGFRVVLRPCVDSDL